MLGQQLVADIMKIADQRHLDAALGQLVADMRHRGSGFIPIHGDADDFRTGPGQGCHLPDGGLNIRRVGIGHGLHDNRRGLAIEDPADLNAPDHDAGCAVAGHGAEGGLHGQGAAIIHGWVSLWFWQCRQVPASSITWRRAWKPWPWASRVRASVSGWATASSTCWQLSQIRNTTFSPVA